MEQGDGRLRAIFNTVGDGLIVLDRATGVVVEANRAAGRMQGCLPRDFIGRGLADFVHDDSIEGLVVALQGLPVFGDIYIRVRHVRPDGSTFAADWIAAAITEDLKDGVVVQFREVSARIAAERLKRRRLEARLQDQDVRLAASSAIHDQSQALAVLEERQRLARNLHDAVNQSLFSAGLIAEVLPRLWERDQAEARRSLQDLRRLMRSVQDEMRTLLAELRPSILHDADLGSLVRLLANSLSSRTAVSVTLNLATDVVLPPKVHEAFYRVCQEALSNVGKHARAQNVEVTLEQTETVVFLRIRDDGIGFKDGHVALESYGLSMMRERADAVGASLSIGSQPGQGTDIRLRWSRAPREEVT